jgi:hypothetical protein
MAGRAKKRQKTDPSPVKPDTKTLFHFFSKPPTNPPSAFDITPPRTESDSGSLHDEPRRKSDIASYNGSAVTAKTENTPPPGQLDDSPLGIKLEPMEFVAGFTEREDTCSPTKEDRMDPFEGLDEIEDDEYQDQDFRDEELNFPYERFEDDNDDIDDDYDTSKANVKREEKPPDPTVDEGPSCPFCNFSFKGLSEDVLSSP